MKGIIPARAGFTHPFCFPIYYLGDHPRSRGVYPSCPNGWGRRGGIIPARAGFTRSYLSTPEKAEDHPRSRGVYYVLDLLGVLGVGSSPLARGLLLAKNFRRQDVRIIPARAGFTPGKELSPPGRKDHPRSRGVYEPSPSATTQPLGSSPLARGLRYIWFSTGSFMGIIPARAGFTGRCRSTP